MDETEVGLLWHDKRKKRASLVLSPFRPFNIPSVLQTKIERERYKLQK